MIVDGRQRVNPCTVGERLATLKSICPDGVGLFAPNPAKRPRLSRIRADQIVEEDYRAAWTLEAAGGSSACGSSSASLRVPAGMRQPQRADPRLDLRDSRPGLACGRTGRSAKAVPPGDRRRSQI